MEGSWRCCPTRSSPSLLEATAVPVVRSALLGLHRAPEMGDEVACLPRPSAPFSRHALAHAGCCEATLKKIESCLLGEVPRHPAQFARASTVLGDVMPHRRAPMGGSVIMCRGCLLAKAQPRMTVLAVGGTRSCHLVSWCAQFLRSAGQGRSWAWTRAPPPRGPTRPRPPRCMTMGSWIRSPNRCY